MGCIRKMDNNAAMGYAEQVGLPVCLEHGILLPRKSGLAVTVAQGTCKVVGIKRLVGGGDLIPESPIARRPDSGKKG